MKKIKQIAGDYVSKPKPKNGHQGRIALYVDGLRVHALILKQEMLVVAIMETTYFCVDLAKPDVILTNHLKIAKI